MRSPARHPFLLGARPIALAHRGGAREATENSPTAFAHAVGLGFGYIETDVRASADGTCFVLHDARLDRTTDRAGAVAQLPAREVRAARLSNGDSPMTLAQALAAWPQVRFNVDVKSDDTVEPFLAAVTAAGAWDRVCAASFSSSRLRRLRRAAGPRLATSMGPVEVAALVVGAPLHGPVAAQVPQRVGPAPLVTPNLVRRAHRRGFDVHVWTVDDPLQMAHLLGIGVDGIVTDCPTVLADVLRARGLWPGAR